jgi:hypothetical protein
VSDDVFERFGAVSARGDRRLDVLGHGQSMIMISAPTFATSRSARRPAPRPLVAGLWVVLLFLSWPTEAAASLLSPALEDKLAGFLAIVILFIVPVVLIVLFWMVHILPEKIAHKRHHPQFEAIRTLCLLSLAFGGLLWPLAWLWAYSRPVLYKMAYGTDKAVHGEGDEPPSDSGGLHERLARLEERGIPASELKALRADLEALEAKFAAER